VRRVADDDGVRRREGLEARGLVRRRADDLLAVEHDEAGVHGDPHVQAARVRLDRADDVQAAEDRAAGVVLVHPGVAEADQQPVALAVLDEPAVAPDRGGADQAVLAQDRAHLLRIALVGERRRADEVAEHERHLDALVEPLQQPLGRPVAGIEREDRARQRVRLCALAGLARRARVGEQQRDALRDALTRHVARPYLGGPASPCCGSLAGCPRTTIRSAAIGSIVGWSTKTIPS
jgi:hypothetical protein